MPSKFLGYSSIWYVKKAENSEETSLKFKILGYFSSLDKTQ